MHLSALTSSENGHQEWASDLEIEVGEQFVTSFPPRLGNDAARSTVADNPSISAGAFVRTNQYELRRGVSI